MLGVLLFGGYLLLSGQVEGLFLGSSKYRLKENGEPVPLSIRKSDDQFYESYEVFGVIKSRPKAGDDGLVRVEIELGSDSQEKVLLNVVLGKLKDEIGIAIAPKGEIGEGLTWETKTIEEVQTLLKKNYQTKLYLTTGLKEGYLNSLLKGNCDDKCKSSISMINKYGPVTKRTLESLTKSDRGWEIGVVSQLAVGEFR